jgi:hypothetical protein
VISISYVIYIFHFLSLSHSLTLRTKLLPLPLLFSLIFHFLSQSLLFSSLIAAFLHPHRLQFQPPHQKPPRELRVTIPRRESHIKSGYQNHLHLDLLVSTTRSVAARSGGLIFSDIVGGAAAVDNRGAVDKVPTQV